MGGGTSFGGERGCRGSRISGAEGHDDHDSIGGRRPLRDGDPKHGGRLGRLWIERTVLGLVATGVSLWARATGGLEDRAVIEAFYVPLLATAQTFLGHRMFGGDGISSWLVAPLAGALFCGAGLASLAMEEAPWGSALSLLASWLSGLVVLGTTRYARHRGDHS